MIRSFKTINKTAQAELVEKKSKFIAAVKPVESEQEALDFIAAVKKKHWNATHNVFAYQIGQNNETQRQSDDGEPSGTAGLPVLDVLRGEDIKNTVIVVTRYFGGTLLGTGGLVRAYGKTAKMGVEAAEIIEKILYNYVYIIIDYNSFGKVQYNILQKEYVIYNTEYTDKVKLTVLCPFDETDSFIDFITDILGGNTFIEKGDVVYGKWLNGVLKLD